MDVVVQLEVDVDASFDCVCRIRARLRIRVDCWYVCERARKRKERKKGELTFLDLQVTDLSKNTHDSTHLPL